MTTGRINQVTIQLQSPTLHTFAGGKRAGMRRPISPKAKRVEWLQELDRRPHKVDDGAESLHMHGQKPRTTNAPSIQLPHRNFLEGNPPLTFFQTHRRAIRIAEASAFSEEVALQRRCKPAAGTPPNVWRENVDQRSAIHRLHLGR